MGRTSESREDEISFETLDEFLAWVKDKCEDKSVGGVIVRYAKHPTSRGWEIEIYDDYRE